MTQVTKTDNRTLARLAKDIATMRRRVASAVRKHAKLQERIARLYETGCIIWMNKDAEIVVGEDCWYVRAESLNVAGGNWYYEIRLYGEHGYECTCEATTGCKHITSLSASFAPAEKTVLQAIQEMADAHEQAEVARIVAEAHEDYQRLVAPLNYRNAGFQLLRA